jgi:Fe-S cluster biogenesis protein NfuA
MSAPSHPRSLKEQVAHALATDIGPALALDGTTIEVVEVSDGVARLRLDSVCSGCPSTILAVITGLEQELRRCVPEIEFVEVVG